MTKTKTYCGFIKIIGQPNVGKSTLLNKLLGKKISITSKKPQTTHQCIMGIKTINNYQIIYIDTPGISFKKNTTINTSLKSINNVELIIFIVDKIILTDNDLILLSKLKKLHNNIILVINKIDKIIDKKNILPYIKFISKKINFIHILPISAKKEININILSKIINKYIPESKHFFTKNNITDKSKEFIASEIIREKLIRFLGDELPYSTNVKIENFHIKKNNLFIIKGLILIKRPNQKKIIIGKNGNKIKKIGTEARISMEKFFEYKVHLKIWIKII
ncbi:GTPase Era [Candidatus Providencia siddallii]|uniref:GTPase Era n=1 Tax=Candidatus Providencia siddallii TaxID=1715285 RepID=A0ABM9NPQ2_9GAMM